MTGTEVRVLRDEEIGIELKGLRERLYSLRSLAVTEKVEDTSQFKTLRKDVARLMTERNARRHVKEKAAKVAKAAARAAAEAARLAAVAKG